MLPFIHTHPLWNKLQSRGKSLMNYDIQKYSIRTENVDTTTKCLVQQNVTFFVSADTAWKKVLSLASMEGKLVSSGAGDDHQCFFVPVGCADIPIFILCDVNWFGVQSLSIWPGSDSLKLFSLRIEARHTSVSAGLHPK